MKFVTVAAATLVLALSACAGARPEIQTAATFDRIKDSPPRLRAFLAAMPKGADLHVHLSGQVYAESNLAAGLKAGHCLDTAAMRIVAPPCDAQPGGGRPSLSAVMADQALVNRAIDTHSMRNFVPAPGVNGHGHFFATFPRFGEARDAGIMLAEVLNRAGRQQVRHMELMVTFGAKSIAALAAAVPWSGDADTQLAQLEAQDVAAMAHAARAEVDHVLAIARTQMACDGPAPQPGCAVSVRFLQQVNRTAPPQVAAAQVVFGFRLAAADRRVAGINIVAPEDHVVALRDYDLHMRLIGAMAERLPQVGVALHAGELALGLVPPEDLRDHIRKAVLVAGARRIGHGVGVMYEDDPYGLLHLLAERRVAVEINLTSNDVILGVRGAAHPFGVYRQEGVPTTLSTDDEGVSRIDLTHEYQRAVQEHGLDYAELKALSRRGLEYAFLPGASLWADDRAWVMVEQCRNGRDQRCDAFLAASEKARLQWKLEQDFHRFEAGDTPAARKG